MSRKSRRPVVGRTLTIHWLRAAAQTHLNDFHIQGITYMAADEDWLSAFDATMDTAWTEYCGEDVD